MLSFDLDIGPEPVNRGWLWVLAIAASILVLGMALAPGADAKTQRSHQVTAAFQRTHPCPSTGRTGGACPGFVKDHIVPLCHGGVDAVWNLQWQSIWDAKRKDAWECR